MQQAGIRKIGTIALYELRMQWRRRGLLVITLALLLTTVAPVLVIRGDMGADAFSGGTLSPLMVWVIWVSVGAVLAFVLPLIFADTIPRDRQLQVRDLLDSSPLPFGVYLTGKLIGALASVGVMLGVLAAATGAFWWLSLGALDLNAFLGLWMGAAAMAAINIGLIVILNAFFNDGRAAVFVGIIFVVALPLVIGLPAHGDWRDIFNPLRPGLFLHYAETAGVPLNNISLLSVEVTVITGFVQLGLAWAAALLINRLLRKGI